MEFRVLKGSILISAFLFLGCSTHPMDPTINLKPPKYVQEMPSKDEDNINNNPGSLFTNGDNLFADTKAMKVNDIVTVIITEKISQSSQATKKLSEVNNNGGGSFNATASGGIYALGSEIAKVGRTGIDMMLPSMNSSRSFKGSGTQKRDESFQTTVSARIVKVLANGNYFITGRREIYLDGQKQIIELAGVIRPQDISADNTIDSKYISDAKIVYKTEGDIKRSIEKNWFSKFWDAISPW